MSTSTSLLEDLLESVPNLVPQMYFKSSLVALSHAMEDLILAGNDSPLVITCFQEERFYRQEIRRYRQIAGRTDQVYLLAARSDNSSFAVANEPYETIPLDPSDRLAQEWHLIIVSKQYAGCILCREKATATSAPMEQGKRFDGIWTFDPIIAHQAARLLLARIAGYRPELAPKVEEAWQNYNLTVEAREKILIPPTEAINSSIFGQRLVNYLQASQYKLLKAYGTISAQEKKERLINNITATIRSSLKTEDILAAVVRELGQTFEQCRCLLYRCSPTHNTAEIEWEFVPENMASLQGQTWSLVDNPLIQVAFTQEKAIAIADIREAPNLQRNPFLANQLQNAAIRSLLLVPIRHQGKLLGMLEMHCSNVYKWRSDDITLGSAIATQAGVALTQAMAYSDLSTLNHQLETLERTQSNLIAIVGHELRTPLSTIRVCLESLASEPAMDLEYSQVMLDTALEDAERLGKLIQDFLILSRLESGLENWHLEPIQLQECLDLVLSSFRSKNSTNQLPQIEIELPKKLPLIVADAEKLVQVLTKLLDNACKFTEPDGKVSIEARTSADRAMLEAIVTDTGRGIDPSQLEAIFHRFYQEEGVLRRTRGGTGLGLAICRRIIEGLGGEIWADSPGKYQGSRFHFTIPIEASPL